MKLNDKTVVVTGGARGIGEALCHAFAHQGARVVVADILEHEATATAAEIGGFSTIALLTDWGYILGGNGKIFLRAQSTAVDYRREHY